MSHGDTILNLPENFKVITSTGDVDIAGYAIDGEETYGIQFHPEVYHTTEGKQLLSNFVVNICGCSQDHGLLNHLLKQRLRNLKKKLKNDKVVLGLSGGVDSSVAAVLLDKAIGKNLTCIFVDNGLLRKHEFESVLDSYKHMGLNVIGVDAKQKFYKALEGISEPEAKTQSDRRNFYRSI